MAQNVVINGVTYPSVPEVDIPISGGGTAAFYDTTDATLDSGAKMLASYSAYSNGTKYIGSIPTKTSSDLTASGDTVTVPSGYYGSSASKAIAAGSAKTPGTTITANPSLSVDSSTGLVTASVNASQNITPTVNAGYVSAGTAGAVTAAGSDTLQLTTQSAQTITPSTSNQTIPAGTYLTGAQTIQGDAYLVSSNIKNGISIFGVTGSLTSATVSQDGDTKVLTIS